MNKALSIFPRFLSGLIELPNALLQSPLVSGRILPWDNSIDIGSIERPFNEIYSAEVYNSHGILGVNHIDVYEPLSIEGTWNPIIDLQYDNSLQVVNGKLGIVPKILTNADIDLRSDPPIRMVYDPDLIGASILLDFDDDDFAVENKILKTKDIQLKGLGAIFIGSPTDTDFLDDIIDEQLPKMRLIKLKTSDDFVQTGFLSQQLSIKPKGTVGTIVMYDTNGLDANNLFYYSGQTLHVPFVDITPSMSPSWNNAVSLAFVQQLYQALPNNAIDVGAYANGRKYVSVKTDNITIGQSEAGLRSLLKGDTDGDISIVGNLVTSNVTFVAPLMKTGTVVRLNFIAESPDLTFVPATGTLTNNITSGLGLQKIANVISLSPDISTRLGKAESDILRHEGEITTLKSNMLSVQTRTFNLETSQGVQDGRITALEGRVTAADAVNATQTAGITAATATAGSALTLAGTAQTTAIAAQATGTSALTLAGTAQATGVANSTAIGITDTVVSVLGIQTSANTAGLATNVAATTAAAGVASSALTLATTAQSVGVANSSAITGILSWQTGTTATLSAAVSTGIANTTAITTLSATVGTIGTTLAGAVTNIGILDGVVATHTANLVTIDATLVAHTGAISAASALAGTANALAGSAMGEATSALGLAGTANALAGSAMALSTANSASIADIWLSLHGVPILGQIFGDTGLFGDVSSIRSDLDDSVEFTNMIKADMLAYNDSATSRLTNLENTRYTKTEMDTKFGLYTTTASLTTLLAAKQATITTSTALSAGTLLLNTTTDSTSITSGVLQVRGGAGISKALYVGGSIYSAGNVVATQSWVTTQNQQIAIQTAASIGTAIANYYTKSEISSQNQQIQIQTAASIGTAVAPLATQVSLDTAISNLNVSIATKEVPLSFSGFLSRVGNNVSVDLSSFATNASLTSSIATVSALANGKENPITFDSNFIRTLNNVSLNPSISVDTLNVGQSNLKVEKIPLVVPTLTANVDQGYTISASSTYLSYSPWRAFGDSSAIALTDAFLTAARYGSAGTPTTSPSTTTVDGVDYIGEWLQIQVPTPCTVTAFSLQSFNNYMTRHPIQFVFCAENLDGTWTALFNQSTNLSAWTAFQVREFAFPNNTKVSTKYRLVVTRVGTNPTTGYMQILQMSLSAFTRSISSSAPSFTYNGSPIINQTSLDSQLSLKADVTSIPSLAGYATESFVLGKNYITSAALSPYALTSQIPSLTGFATESWVNAKNYITSASLPDLTPYALKTYVTGLGYITSSALPDLNPYALKTFVTSQGYITASSIPDVSGFATTVYVDAGLATKVNQTLFDSTLSNYSTTSQMQTYVTGLNYLTSSSLANYQQTIVAGTGLTKSTNTLSVNASQTQITSVGTLTGLSVSGTSVPSIANTSSTASVNMLTLYQANQPAGYNALRMGRASSSYNHLVISYNYASAGSTSNWCEFGLGSAPHIKIDGLGVTTVDSLIVSNTTNSTSTTNGAVQILGGLGVMKSIWCSSLYGFSADVAELSAGSITISGNSLSTTLTNLQSQIDTKANSSQIVDAYTKTESNTTFPKFYDLDMRLSSERGWTTGNFVQQTHTGVVTLTNNTASTSSTTGALKITGGVGIGGSLYVANNIYMGNNLLATQNGMNSALSGKQNILTSTTAVSIGDLLVNGTSVDFPNLTGGNTLKFGSFQIFSNHSSGYSYIQSGLSSRAGWQDVIFSSYSSTVPNITIRTAGNMGLGNFPANQTEAYTYANVTSTNPTFIVNGGVDCKQLFVSGTMPFLPYQNAGWMWNYNGDWYNASNGYGSMQNGVSIFAKGRIGGIGFIAVSDRRTKDNIHNLPACTETLMKVRPVQYTSKIDGSFNIGIIADEIQDLFPCVSTDPSGLKHMEYQQLYMVAIKALQETINEVKKLKQKLKTLSRNGRNQKRH